jgi:TolB-like protein/DNA-binding winged helix-turn-helix (wHTH) protein/tetratricopeptide (TPR) repeat protein
MQPETRRLAQFGPFHLDLRERLLTRDGKYVPLPPKDLEILTILVEASGRIVEKAELLEMVWPGIFVEEGNLTRHIFNLRQVFADGNREKNQFIETVPKRGYRFVAPITYQDTLSRKPGEIGEIIHSVAERDQAGIEEGARRSTRQDPGYAGIFPLSRYAWLAAGLIALLSTGYYFYARSRAHPVLASHHAMLAVLPVQNLSGNSAFDYEADGLTEELIAQLGRLDPKDLGVIARTSSMAYKDTKKTVGQIGEELGVDYVLETSLRQSDGHLRFTAQLVRTGDQTHLWAQQFDKQSGDLIDIQEELGSSVASQIRGILIPESIEAVQPLRPATGESHAAYVQGRTALSLRSKDGLTTAVQYFRQAIEKDPTNALAYAGMADAYNLMVFYGFTDGSSGITGARESAEKAIMLDERLAEGHAALAYVNFMWRGNWPEAEKEFRRAIELNENYSAAHHWFALYLSAVGRPDEAIEEIKTAETLDPRSPAVKSAAGWVYYFARQPRLSANECLSALQLNPNFMVAHAVLGLSYEERGQYEQAITEFRRSIELAGFQQPTYLGYLGHAYAASGRRDAAKEVVHELDESSKVTHVGQWNKAVIYAGMKDKDRAFEALLASSAENDGSNVWLGVNPELDNLRSDPRFAELLSHRHRER